MAATSSSSNSSQRVSQRFTVGLTGGIGSGKSTVGKLFEQHGIAVIDADAAAHALTGPDGDAMPALRAAFGDQIATADNALDRAQMRTLAFGNPQVRQQLEAILHPRIHAWMTEAASQAHGPYLILMIPLLIESGRARSRCDRILVIDCDEPTQINRVMQRSGLSRDEVQRIMAQQVSRQTRLSAADDVIDNSQGLDGLADRVAQLDSKYRQLASGNNSATSVAPT